MSIFMDWTSILKMWGVNNNACKKTMAYRIKRTFL